MYESRLYDDGSYSGDGCGGGGKVVKYKWIHSLITANYSQFMRENELKSFAKMV